jgi:hypothetical protein
VSSRSERKELDFSPPGRKDRRDRTCHLQVGQRRAGLVSSGTVRQKGATRYLCPPGAAERGYTFVLKEGQRRTGFMSLGNQRKKLLVQLESVYPDLGRQKFSTKKREISCFEVLNVLFGGL